jgi:chromosomal replication initiator protein
MQLAHIWKQVLVQIQPHINPKSFDTWLKPTTLLSVKNTEVQVTVPNSFFCEWIREHYSYLIKNALEKELSEENVRIHFVIQDVQAWEEKEDEEEELGRRREKRKGSVNPKYSFRSFVVGSSNQFAHAASLKVAEQPGISYNPLFLYGGVGLGKTHLLSAIGNFILARDPLLRVAYLSSEQFTNDVINSIRYDRMIECRSKYRSVDVLLVDDIQFIAGKERTQEEFFHTFNTLYDDNKQVVISSDRSAKEMSGMEERLRSRFEMGLIADVQPPDFETRVAILRKKAANDEIDIPDDVALLLATHIKSNIRKLEGSLIRLGAFSSLTGHEITLEMAKRVLRDTIHEQKKVITVDNIQRMVSERFQVKIVELKSKRRTKNLVYPRQIGMYLSRQLTNLSFPEIGKSFGGKDHSTVIHACKHIEKEKQENFNLRTTLESLAQHLKEE